MEEVKTHVGGIVRHFLTTLGGYLVSAGLIQQEQLGMWVGGGMVLFGLVWSLSRKYVDARR